MKTILFIDDWALQRRYNIVRELGKPKWVPEATLEDDLTEGTWNFPTVWFDSRDKKWKAIYCGAANYPSKREFNSPNITFSPKTQVLLYAESEDGVKWHRPDLSSVTNLRVRHRPNQVFESGVRMDGAPVYYDPHELDPDRRLKYLFSRGEAHETEQGMATSPDGIHWTIDSEPWSRRYMLDAPITLFYNQHRDSYMISNRFSHTNRRITLTETKDFKSFSPAELVVFPDPEDPPMVQFYGMPVFPYEDMYIGLLWRYHTDQGEIGMTKYYGPIDCSLAYSYTGLAFNRAFHDVFISRPELGNHGCGCIYVASMVVDNDNVIRFYSGGSKAEHFRNQDLTDAALMLHTLRLDGFASLKTYATVGDIITKGLIFTKPNLRINARAPYGSVRVQVLDERGDKVDGLTLADSIPFRGDELFYTPKWKSGAGLDKVLNQPVYLQIELTEGEIFAIRGDFTKTPNWDDTAR